MCSVRRRYSPVWPLLWCLHWSTVLSSGRSVRSLDTWAGGWCTTFNASKSAHMFISSKHRRSGDTSRSSLSLSGGIIPLVGRLLILVFGSQALSHGQTTWATSFDGSSSKLFCWNAWLVVTDLLTLLSGCTDVSFVLCSSMLRLFGMHAPNMTPLPWSASSCR